MNEEKSKAWVELFDGALAKLTDGQAERWKFLESPEIEKIIEELKAMNEEEN